MRDPWHYQPWSGLVQAVWHRAKQRHETGVGQWTYWKPGCYEIEPGITLRHFLDEICGGVVGELGAILMGGAAGTFLLPDEIDVRLTFEDLRAAGSTFGSGAIMVFNQTTDLRDVLKRLGRFFQHESCGKCFPCQLGTQRQVEILERLDTPAAGDRERLHDIGMTMTEASICGLGHTAAIAVMSAMEKFPVSPGIAWRGGATLKGRKGVSSTDIIHD